MDTYDETVKEVAEDLGLDESDLREAFSYWLNEAPGCKLADSNLDEHIAAACYAVYRLTKTKSAFKGLMASCKRRGRYAFAFRDHFKPSGSSTVYDDPGMIKLRFAEDDAAVLRDLRRELDEHEGALRDA